MTPAQSRAAAELRRHANDARSLAAHLVRDAGQLAGLAPRDATPEAIRDACELRLIHLRNAIDRCGEALRAYDHAAHRASQYSRVLGKPKAPG